MCADRPCGYASLWVDASYPLCATLACPTRAPGHAPLANTPARLTPTARPTPQAVTAGKAGSTTAGTSQQDTAAAERERERQRERERERERERSPGHDPLRDDRFPGRAPGLPPGWGGPGLVPPVGGGGPGGLFLPDGGLEGPGSMGPLGGGGGMHVGPGHPFFAGGWGATRDNGQRGTVEHASGGSVV